MMQLPIFTLMFLGLSLFLSGCSNDQGLSDDPDIIRVSVLPDQAPDELQKRYTDLLDYLGKETGKQVELVLAKNYQDLLQLFHENKVHLARFGGFTFIKASQGSGAVPVVMRDIDAKFVSYFVVRATDPADSLLDFKGKRFTFGSKLSTSGHLMPRYFLQQEGITPEKFFSDTGYSGAHDATVYLVRDGKFDLGVANAVVVNRLFASGQVGGSEIRVLWKTPPYPDYVWAMQGSLSKKLNIQITNAFLKLSRDNEQHKKILDQVAADSYLPASTDDFKALHNISLELGLLGGD